MHIKETDKEQEQYIVKLFHRGESSAPDELYAEYADYLTGVCTRYITNEENLKDILQESFIKIFAKIDRFKYRGQGSLRGWMSKIVVNESLQFIRHNLREPATDINTEPTDIIDEDTDIDGMNADILINLLRQLSNGYRVVLNLYVIEGKSHKEIAKF